MRQIGDITSGLVAGVPEPTPESKLSETVREPHVPLSARAPNRGYLARELVQCTLPHREPKSDVYIRTDGNFRFMIESGTDIQTGEKFGLPYGSLPRLLMLFLNTEAVRKQGREDELVISFGHTMNEFLRNVGCDPLTGGGKRGDAARLRTQHNRLFNARFTFARLDGDSVFGSETRKPLEIAQEIRTFWDYRNPNQGTLWESYVLLTPEFQQALVANPVPYDFDHLRALKRSPLALDLYCWLTYRIYRANNKTFTVPFKALHEQFGTGYSRMDNFKAALWEALNQVSDVYGAISYNFTPYGLEVEPISRRELPVPPDAKLLMATPSSNAPAPPRLAPVDHRRFLIMPEDLRKVDRLARKRGLVLDEMLVKWREWCIAGNVRPANPAAHFSTFLKNHRTDID